MSLVLNVLGGILAGVALIGFEMLCRYLVARRFRRFFGLRDTTRYHIVHTLYKVASGGQFPLPESRVERPVSGSGINLQQVVSGATVRATGYLVGAFSKGARFARLFAGTETVTPVISSHTDVDENMDMSFVSIGLRTNFKSVDVLRNAANYFLDLGSGTQQMQVVEKHNPSSVVAVQSSKNQDIGLIVKIHPDGDKTRTWICCGGFGIVGTSGAAYYLAQKWAAIRKWTGDEPFGCVLETTVGSDESTRVTKILVNRLRGLARLRRWLRHADDSPQIVELDSQ